MKKADRSLCIVHFRDRRGATLLRYMYRRRNHRSSLMNRTEALSGYDFRAGAKAIRYSVNIALCSLICKIPSLKSIF